MAPGGGPVARFVDAPARVPGSIPRIPGFPCSPPRADPGSTAAPLSRAYPERALRSPHLS